MHMHIMHAGTANFVGLYLLTLQSDFAQILGQSLCNDTIGHAMKRNVCVAMNYGGMHPQSFLNERVTNCSFLELPT